MNIFIPLNYNHNRIFLCEFYVIIITYLFNMPAWNSDRLSELYDSLRKGRRDIPTIAILTSGRNIISSGINSDRGYQLRVRACCRRTGKMSFSRQTTPSLHAEPSCIENYFTSIARKRQIKGRRVKVDLIVLRKNKTGRFVNSKPCYHCTEYIKSRNVLSFLRIRKIIYHDTSLKFDNLSVFVASVISSGWMKWMRDNGTIDSDICGDYIGDLTRRL